MAAPEAPQVEKPALRESSPVFSPNDSPNTSNEKSSPPTNPPSNPANAPKTSTHIQTTALPANESSSQPQQPRSAFRSAVRKVNDSGFRKCIAVLVKFARFTGPGAIISVAYIDPDNFQTSLTSGATFGFKLLFVILVSNLLAIYLQALAVKLGAVTGMDLAQMNRAHLPRWLNFGLWVMAEAAIVCADIGQVIGTAIAINILIPQIPLVGGCILSATDTLIILLFYKPDGSLRALRWFELFVSAFIIGVFISFCIELSYVTSPAGDVFKGFLPSRDIFVSQGLYQSCAILGGTLMPHTLYLGSGLVQARMRDLDRQTGTYRETPASDSKFSMMIYRPSLGAVRSCLSYSIAELCITLFIFAVFINSAILIISASELSSADGSQTADLFGMYDLFVANISQASGTIFALALLFSGISAGIVTTLAGQLVAEGAMDWRMSPFYRRLCTRCVAIIPGTVIAATVGRAGLAAALNGCNVVLSVSLIFITFPLVWFTSFGKYMTVKLGEAEAEAEGNGVMGETTAPTAGEMEAAEPEERVVSFANNWATAIAGACIWVVIAAMNIATLVFLGMGVTGDGP